MNQPYREASPPPLVTKEDRVFVDVHDVTHAVHAGVAAMYRAGKLKNGPLRARCKKESPNWGPRDGDVVTCGDCVAYLRRRALAYVAGGKGRRPR